MIIKGKRPVKAEYIKKEQRMCYCCEQEENEKKWKQINNK